MISSISRFLHLDIKNMFVENLTKHECLSTNSTRVITRLHVVKRWIIIFTIFCFANIVSSVSVRLHGYNNCTTILLTHAEQVVTKILVFDRITIMLPDIFHVRQTIDDNKFNVILPNKILYNRDGYNTIWSIFIL